MVEHGYSVPKPRKQNSRNGTVIYMGNIEFPDKCAAAHRVINNAKILRELGFNVVFLGIAYGDYFEGVRQADYDHRFYEEAYPDTLQRWIMHIFDIRSIRRLADEFTDLKLIIAYNVPFATFKAMKKAFKDSKVKLAYDCTEWNSYTEGSIFKRIFKKVDEFEIIHFLQRECDHFIAVSSVIENRYKNRNTLLLPPLVDVTEPIWHQSRDAHPRLFEFCFSAATLDNKDDPGNVIRAFCLLKDPCLRLTVIGLDKKEALQRYPDVYDAITNDSRIEFTGILAHADVIRRLSSSDCFVFFRRDIRRNRAGFPTKFVEAYTCGVPVLTNRVGDTALYGNRPGRVFLAENTSVENIKDHLLDVFTNSRVTDREKDDTFDYRNYISRTKEWINRIC